jgi:spore maturation protein CgeB
MKKKLSIRYFAHSWVSDWNHGNAHFLRGLARALVGMGHQVRCYEQLGSWSLTNLVRQEGERAIAAIDDFRRAYPQLDIHFYKDDESFSGFAAEELRDADVVIIHEWTAPSIVNAILELKRQCGFKVLLHDTHHRAYTSPRDILRFHLPMFDGVLAFGEAIRRIYHDGFGMARVWTFHEAADVEKFVPVPARKITDVLWIGNWGDEERSLELREFLVGPAARLKDEGRKFVAYGVRYPQEALVDLAEAGIEYRGYLPNLRGPSAYGEAAIALHIPRRQYANGLSGVPTIRMFEAMACGAALVCSPWDDTEALFRAGEDYWTVSSGEEMHRALLQLLADDGAQRQLAASGRETILKRHTCSHRAQQLTEICEQLG